MEHLLQYAWKHKLFPLKPLQTTTGESVEVIDPGLHNRNAGPDFFNAKLKIDDTMWVGNVEIHSRSSDWMRHGHDRDSNYDSVILHVAETVDTDIFRTNGELIPQLVFTCPESVRRHYDELRRADSYPCCHPVLPALSRLTIHGWLTALQTERLQQKATLIGERLTRYNNHWEDVFFITLARGYGFGVNGDCFERWACTLPFRALDKHRDDIRQIEAFFFGQAGLLESATDDGDDYYSDLQKEYRHLQRKFSLTRSSEAGDWRFLRMRPDNFPTIRLAQLAWIYQTRTALFSRLMEAKTTDEVHELLATRTSAYWEFHYVFGKPSPRKEKTMGKRSIDLLIINVVVPLLYAYGRHKANDELCDRALRFLELLKPEDNHVTHSWAIAGLPVTSAADSQALMQLQREYCEKRKCLFCRFGYEYIRHKAK